MPNPFQNLTSAIASRNARKRRESAVEEAILFRLEGQLGIVEEARYCVENGGYNNEAHVAMYAPDVDSTGRFRTVVEVEGQLEEGLPFKRPRITALRLKYTGRIDPTTLGITDETIVVIAGGHPYREKVKATLERNVGPAPGNLKLTGIGSYRLRI